ncbi:hypothetical protein Cni_G13629 [Canna indica]|uniref:Uncharacterized protein n=1 Tax=Canna indica TaxID=4628 RepID=A0AAQ3QCW2_9LILI|nr:hypothetical protein Cni_G13629 [Canna indica]
MVVVADAEEGNPIAEEVDGSDSVADDTPGEVIEEPIFDDADDVHVDNDGVVDEVDQHEEFFLTQIQTIEEDEEEADTADTEDSEDDEVDKYLSNEENDD